jgi:hypothetical protein
MSEEGMEHAVQQALAREGIDEPVLAAGRFNPRGHPAPNRQPTSRVGSRGPGVDVTAEGNSPRAA